MFRYGKLYASDGVSGVTPAVTAPQAPVVTPPAAAAVPEGWEGEFTAERAKSTFAAMREEMRGLKDKVKAAELASMSEVDRLRAEAADAKAQLETVKTEAQKERIQSKALVAATKLGFNDPEDAWRFLDMATAKPEEIEGQLADLLKKRPYLGNPSPPAPLPQAGEGSRSPQARAGNPEVKSTGLTFEDVQRMSTAEVQRRWSEVEPVLRGGR